jgi:hypothetical protein
MMLNFTMIRALIDGTLAVDNRTKQRLGQRFARALNLTPGPGGPDDGIDGIAEYAGIKIHFQCKLRGVHLDRDDARGYYSDLKYHRVAVSVMLAGTGYKDTFRERLFGHHDIDSVRIHLLTLEDLFLETDAHRLAVADLPPLQGLASIAASETLPAS